MKSLWLAASTALLPAAALAADLPVRTMAPAPVVTQKAFNWTGFHAGALIGGSASRAQSRYTYGSVEEGVGFNNGSVQSSWFDGYASGSLPAETSNSLTPSASCFVYDQGKGLCSDYGYGSSENTNPTSTTSQRTNAAIPLDVDSRKIVGALGGEVGYLAQTGSLVFGVSLDGMFFSKRDADKWSSTGDYSRDEATTGSASYEIPNNNITVNGSVSRHSEGSSQYSSSIFVAPKWLSTVRLSAGIAQDRFMAYVSGGLAVGGVNSVISSSYSDSNSSICSGTAGGLSSQSSSDGTYDYDGSASVVFNCGTGSNNVPASISTDTSANWRSSRNDIQYGYVLGGGLAFAVSQNVIAKLEGYYYDLGTVTSVVTGTAQQTTSGSGSTTTDAASYTVKTKVDGVLGRAGIAYKF